MVLRKLKRDGEVARDVRRLGIAAEKKSTGCEKFLLSEEEFDKLLEQDQDTPQDNKISVAIKLSIFFPAKEAEILTRLGLEKQAIMQQWLQELQEADSLMRQLTIAADYKLFSRNMEIREKILPPQEYALEINKLVDSATTPSDIEKVFYYRRCFKIIYPEMDQLYFNDRIWWPKVQDYIQRALKDDDLPILRIMDFLGDLKILYAKNIQEFYTPELRAKAIARLEDSKREHGSFTYLDIDGLLSMIIFDTDEVLINETGLHLINHPAPESMEAALPEQPLTKEI